MDRLGRRDITDPRVEPDLRANKVTRVTQENRVLQDRRVKLVTMGHKDQWGWMILSSTKVSTLR